MLRFREIRYRVSVHKSERTGPGMSVESGGPPTGATLLVSRKAHSRASRETRRWWCGGGVRV